MKLRIRGNSLRLRVTRSELTQLAEHGMVEDTIRFAPTAQLRYRLVREQRATALRAEYDNNGITVFVPAPAADDWADSERVGLEGVQTTRNEVLKILIEKDFVCLVPRDGEDQSDAFPNPAAVGSDA